MDYVIRKYAHSDYSKVLNLFDLNTPDYFSPSERNDLENYLNSELEEYFILELDKEVIASGGINYSVSTAKISWDFVHPTFHGKGFGSALLNHRIEYIKTNYSEITISVRTSQFAFGFYQKCGFEIINTEKDYWAKGFDLVEMIFDLGASENNPAN